MRNPHDIIRKPVVTEESMNAMAENKYTFVVDKTANKTEIKNAVETIFGVRVKRVNTMNMNGKLKRQGRYEGKRADWKKAIVELTEDSKAIEIFEGLE